MEVNKQSGQTVVEYILLLAVSISLVLTFYRSDAFRRLFGSQGSVGAAIREENEWGYRHAYLLRRNIGTEPVQYSGPDHPSYYDSNEGETRFFGPRAFYP